MQRVIVVGTSGAGKTTLARQLAERYQLRHIELDRLFWRPGWQQPDHVEFRALVARAVSGLAWVVDGNYSMLYDVTWPHASDVIWLNYALPTVLWQLTRRTITRIAAGREVFPGCRETFQKSFLSRDSVIWYAIRTYHVRRERFVALRQERRYPQLVWRELRSPRETRRFLAEL